LAAVVFYAGCGNTDHGPAAAGGATRKTTTIQWIDSVRNLGKINEGQKLAVSFRFRNSGTNPLVIESVQPSCGCTVADFPKEPIAPNKEGEIAATFDSEGREGLQHKELTVRANTGGSGEQKIVFEVDVQGKAHSDAGVEPPH